MPFPHYAFTPSEKNQHGEFTYTTPIKGLYYLAPKQFGDHRGFYAELARVPEVEELTQTPFVVKQLNLSNSNSYVIRGFHAENWNKLVSVTSGKAFCVWVDIRPESETFGHSVSMTLGNSETESFGSMFIEKGIANSICVTKSPVSYVYAVDQLYTQRDTSNDVAISLFDEDIAIKWPLSVQNMIISDRDRASITLRKKYPEKFR